jgi:hypothetical protein
MKKIQSPPGYHHISILTFSAQALGCSRRKNIEKFMTWFCELAESQPYITAFEIVCGDESPESEDSVYFHVIYTDRNGLEEVRNLAEHQKMIAWFNQVSGPVRLNVDKLIETV